jgi:O-antigen/teichoic acid export membrane protein
VQGAFPSLSRASGQVSTPYNHLFQHCYQDVAFLFLPVSLWAIAYAREIVLLLFKRPEYLAAVPVFRVFQIGLVLAALGNLYGIGGLVAFHRDREYQHVLVLTAGVFLPVCVVWTVHAGILGASLAVLSAQVLSFFLFIHKTRDLLQVKHMAALAGPACAGLGVVAASKFLGLGLFPSALLLFLVYAGLLGNRLRPARQLQSA